MKNPIYAPRALKEEPHVGIFWITPKKEIVKYSEPVSRVAQDSIGFKNVDVSHASYWSRIKGNLIYNTHGYTDYPRGRVLAYNEKILNESKSAYKIAQRFLVYVNSAYLKDQEFRENLLQEFNITTRHVKWETDPHYENGSETDFSILFSESSEE
jgi:hypothetical protein